MTAPLDHSWIALAGVFLASLLCGGVVRHLWGLHADRAHANRVSALCDQLDAKDAKLHGIRAELLAAHARVQELQGALAARFSVGAPADWAAASLELQPIRIDLGPQADPALRLEDNEDPAFFRRRIRALGNRVAA
jgi:hypothetical protein